MSITHTTYFHPVMDPAKRYRRVLDREGRGFIVDQNPHPKVLLAQKNAKRPAARPTTSGFSQPSELELKMKKEQDDGDKS